MRKFILLLLAVFLAQIAVAQTPDERHRKIRAAADEKNYSSAVQELQNLRRENEKIFTLNNYDYLLGRFAEKQGDLATAAASYQTIINRDSILKEYALWHLAELM